MRVIFVLMAIAATAIACSDTKETPQHTPTLDSVYLTEQIRDRVERFPLGRWLTAEELNGLPQDALFLILSELLEPNVASGDPEIIIQGLLSELERSGFDLPPASDLGLAAAQTDRTEVERLASEIESIVDETPLSTYLTHDVLVQVDSDALNAIAQELRSAEPTASDVIEQLEALREVAVEAGLDEESDVDLGLASAKLDREAAVEELRSEIGSIVDGTAVEPNFSEARLKALSTATLTSVRDTLRSVSDLNQDVVATLNLVLSVAAEAGLDMEGQDFGLATVQADRERAAELASRPRVEVMEVDVGEDWIGTPEFTVTFRNNYAHQVDGLEFYAWAYDRFGDGLGSQCGRFPTFYSSSNVQPGTDGESFRANGDTLCVDTAVRFEIQITRVHFTDGTTWAP